VSLNSMWRMFGSKREEVTAEWVKPHNIELHICGSHHLIGLSNEGQ
jgi:hypothetical protein